MAEVAEKQVICHICEAGCGLTAQVSGDEVLAVRGNKDDLLSGGYLCPKGVSLKELHEDPDRLRSPMVRDKGVLREASWEEAWARIAEALPRIREAYGNDALAVYIGNPTAHALGLGLGAGMLRHAAGTRNMYSAGSVDQFPKQLACGYTYGDWSSVPVPDIDRSDYLLVIGANPLVSNGSLWMVPDFRGRARKMRERGGKLVVVDPRRTETAQAADEHHFIRPGTDAYFLMGILKALFERNAPRPAHLDAHLNGWEELAACASGFSYGELADACGIAEETMKEIAATLATTERAAVYGRCGTSIQEFGTLASWLIEQINIVAGNLDAEGGAMLPAAIAFANNTKGPGGRGRGAKIGRHRSRVRNFPEVLGEYPIATLADEIETGGEGQVRALICVAGNPVVSGPNPARLSKALASLDFLLAIDIYQNETTRHADVILPSVSHFCRPHYDLFLGAFVTRHVARYSAPLFERPAGMPSDWQIFLQLGSILRGSGVLDAAGLRFAEDQIIGSAVDGLIGPGAPLEGRGREEILDALAPLEGEEKMLDLEIRTGPYGDRFGQKPDGLTLARLKANPNGIDLGPLEPRVPEVLRTPSGKIEMWPAELSAEIEHLRAKLGEARPAFTLIGRRHVRSNNSWLHNLPVLAKGPFRCTAQINPQDAARLGIADGGNVSITSRRGAVVAVAEITEDMMPGVVSLPHGWGHDEPGVELSIASERPGVNSNLLADDELLDGPTGTAVLNGIPVEVAAA